MSLCRVNGIVRMLIPFGGCLADMENADDNGITWPGQPWFGLHKCSESCAGGRRGVPAGVLGFIPGVTTNYSQLGAAGPASEAMLLGVFQVSILHNLVHLLFGVAGLALARSAVAARNYLLWGGAVYLVLWIYGLLIGPETAANFVPLNSADNWLHLVLGIGMIALGFLLTRGAGRGRQ